MKLLTRVKELLQVLGEKQRAVASLREDPEARQGSEHACFRSDSFSGTGRVAGVPGVLCTHARQVA